MNEKHKIILTILNNSEFQLSVKEIRDRLDPAEQGNFNEQDALSKLLSDMKRKKNYIKNGLTVYENNKTLLTWVISDTGKAALAAAMNTQLTMPTVESETMEETALDTTDCLIKLTKSANDILDLIDVLAATPKQPDLDIPTEDQLNTMISVLDNYRSFITPINADHASVTSDAIALLERLKAA